MSVHMRPEEIEAESFRIIEQEAGAHGRSAQEWEVVRRAIHTSADFEYVQSMIFGNDPISTGITALRMGADIITDTTMAMAGISKPRLAACSGTARCFIGDPNVAVRAREEGVTRSIIAMREAVARFPGGIFVIGNAPTALFELIRLVRTGEASPSLILGLPVGFVGAAESKEALEALGQERSDVPFITNRGRKGGSNVAAAVVNALVIMAAREGDGDEIPSH